MRVLSGPCAVLEPAEAGKLLVAARRGTKPLRATQGALPAGVDHVLRLLASRAPVLDGQACALLVALVRAAESAGILGGLDVGADLRELVRVVAIHRAVLDPARDRLAEQMFRNIFAETAPTRPELISTEMVAERFGVSDGYVRRLARQRRLGGEERPASKGGWLIRAEDAEDFFARPRRRGRPRRMGIGDVHTEGSEAA